MVVQTSCPENVNWPAVLGDRTTPERESYERHLEDCPHCQERLDHAEPSSGLLVGLVRQVAASATTPDPVLTEVLERLHDGPGHREDGIDLYFLEAGNDPGSLGTLGGYDVRRVIGQGGMGVVLEAFEPALHRLVAIKVLSPALAGSLTARRRFTREAQAAAAVCHENVVAVHGVHEANGLPYLVMQHVAGESLQARLDRAGPLETLDIVRIGMQTASGLAAAHAQGLVHRDVKPANLLLEETPSGCPHVKITDFGLARMVDDVGLTQQGVVAGTPEYVAPEQARAEALDHRADLFSLGSVLYAMCTGQPPFRGTTTLGVLRQVCEQEPQPIRTRNPAVPVWLETLILRLLAKDPALRLQTAAEVARLLDAFLAHLLQPSSATAPEFPPHPSPIDPDGHGANVTTNLRRPLGLVKIASLGLMACLFLASLAVGIGFLVTGARGEEPTGTKALQEHRLSLGGLAEDRQGVETTGPDADQAVRFEADGVRLTLPEGYKGPPGFFGERPDTGLIVPVGVQGDFEITVSYEILKEPRRVDAGYPQTRFSLDVAMDRETHKLACLSRRMARYNGSEFLTWVRLGDDDKGKFKEFRTTSKVGKLRLARTGSTLSCYAAEDREGSFTLLQQYPFGTEDLEDVRLVASTGGEKAGLDVRVTDLHIRAESLRQAGGLSIGLPREKGSLVVVLAFSLATALAVGMVLTLRSGGGTPTPPAGTSTEAQPSKPRPRPATVSFTCSGCGKKLEARSVLAGKKVRCPQCGQGVVVEAKALEE